MIWVPPGGAAGASQQTPAAKASMGMLRRVTPAHKRKGTKAAKRYARNKRALAKGTGKKRGPKLKFGSPAWQAKYGNKKRRKRKK